MKRKTKQVVKSAKRRGGFNSAKRLTYRKSWLH